VSASPTPRHQAVLRNLVLAICGFVIPRRLGEAFFAPLDVFLSERDVVVPDLLYVKRERLAIVRAAVPSRRAERRQPAALGLHGAKIIRGKTLLGVLKEDLR
jgi:hypothetical protein